MLQKCSRAEASEVYIFHVHYNFVFPNFMHLEALIDSILVTKLSLIDRDMAEL